MNKRESILHATLLLLTGKGEQATSMKLVAQEAGCGMGTMYNYFESKTSLINTLYLELSEKKKNFILDGLDDSGPIKQKFIYCWTKAMEFARSFPVEYKFLENFNLSPLISESGKAQESLLFNRMIALYEEGKTQGIVKEIPSSTLVHFNKGALSAVILQTPDLTDELIRNCVRMAWDAIKG